MIKESVDRESDIICELLSSSFAARDDVDNNFDIVKGRELKVLKAMFDSSETYYVFNFKELNHSYGFNKIDSYFDYAIRGVYPNKRLYDQLKNWRSDLPYKNAWALIFGTWKFFNILKNLSTIHDLDYTKPTESIIIKPDSINNYISKPYLENYHNCGNPENCEYKEFSLEFKRLTDKDPNQWIAIGQNIGSGTLWTYLNRDFEMYKNEVLVTLSELSIDAKILFLSRFIKENGRSDKIDRKIFSFLNDELNKSILEKTPNSNLNTINQKKVSLKYLICALKIIAFQTNDLPELKNAQNQKKALEAIYNDLEKLTKLNWHRKPALPTLKKDWINFNAFKPSKDICNILLNKNVLVEYPELIKWLESHLNK